MIDFFERKFKKMSGFHAGAFKILLSSEYVMCVVQDYVHSLLL